MHCCNYLAFFVLYEPTNFVYIHTRCCCLDARFPFIVIALRRKKKKEKKDFFIEYLKWF